LPCCNNTKPIMAIAEMTCTTITRLNKLPMLFHFKIKVLYRFVSTALYGLNNPEKISRI
jgi:hypothetical protein